jgi:di/tricarboxylate transporter
MLQGVLSFELLGLSGNAWFSIAVVVAIFAAMIFSRVRTDIIFLAGMAALFVSGVLGVKEAFGGFCSTSVLVIAVLYAVIAGLNHTGFLNLIVKHLMGSPKTLTMAIVRTMLPVALLSSILTNTTVVALFIDIVKIWSKKLGISPSKLLIPLSYASGMGGICTLLGTPTNLIVSGLYTDSTNTQLSIFTTTVCGLFCLAVGVCSIIAMQKLLPERNSLLSGVEDGDITMELQVPSKHPFIGMELREIYEKNPQAFEKDKQSILAIRRFDNEVEVATPDSIIMGSDHIIVSGKAEQLQWICDNLQLKNNHLKGVLENAAKEKIVGRKTNIATVIMIAMVVLPTIGVMDLLSACLLAAGAMIACRCCTSQQAMNAVNWNILMVFAGSICLGKALEITGVSQMIAQGLLTMCGSSPLLALISICLVATFVTEFISNAATAAMFCPIAISTATALGVSPLTFCVALMIAVNSSFATPIGSPTHMLVYGAGGYRFTDFVKIGLPMNFIILAANIFITTIVFPL